MFNSVAGQVDDDRFDDPAAAFVLLECNIAILAAELCDSRRRHQNPMASTQLRHTSLTLAGMDKLGLALLAVMLSARCASIVHGRSQVVPVRSTPSGATIHVDCGTAPANGGTTPAEVILQRKAEHCAITMTMPGYDDQTVTFTRVASRVVWTNLVPGLALGLLAGAATVNPLSTDDDNAGNKAAVTGIIVGAGAGAAIDVHTGAAFRQIPSSVDVTLQRRP